MDNSNTQISAAQRDWLTPILCVLVLAGGSSLLLMTRWGVGISPDSVHYIQLARSLRDGVDAATSSQHAPLYSWLLAGVGLLGIDPLDGARWINVALFGFSIVVAGLLLSQLAPSARWLSIIGVMIAFGSRSAFTLYGSALSEPLFVPLVLLALYLLGAYLTQPKPATLVGAASTLSLAVMTRYAGIAYVIAGMLAIVLFGSASRLKRLGESALFGIICSAPMFLWNVWNKVGSDGDSLRLFALHPITRSDIWDAFYTASGWLLIPVSAPNSIRLAICAGVIGVLVLAYRLRSPVDSPHKTHDALPVRFKVLLLSVLVYGVFLAISISLFDANTPLDDRILFPAYVVMVIACVHVVAVAWPIIRNQKIVLFMTLTSITVLSAGHLVSSATLLAEAYAKGWGFNSVAWQHSPILAEAAKLPESSLVYSNAPEVVYLHTGRAPRSLPRKWLAMNDEPNRNFGNEWETLANGMTAGCVYVIYVRVAPQPALPSEYELKSQLQVTVSTEEVDGTILQGVGCVV